MSDYQFYIHVTPDEEPDYPVGTIWRFPEGEAPTGWLPCDGEDGRPNLRDLPERLKKAKIRATPYLP